MITVNNINGVPEVTYFLEFGVHSDDNYFYFFESLEENINFYKELNNQQIVDLEDTTQ